MTGYIVVYTEHGVPFEEEFHELDDADYYAKIHLGTVYAVEYEETDREEVLSYSAVEGDENEEV